MPEPAAAAAAAEPAQPAQPAAASFATEPAQPAAASFAVEPTARASAAQPAEPTQPTEQSSIPRLHLPHRRVQHHLLRRNRGNRRRRHVPLQHGRQRRVQGLEAGCYNL